MGVEPLRRMAGNRFLRTSLLSVTELLLFFSFLTLDLHFPPTDAHNRAIGTTNGTRNRGS